MNMLELAISNGLWQAARRAQIQLCTSFEYRRTLRIDLVPHVCVQWQRCKDKLPHKHTEKVDVSGNCCVAAETALIFILIWNSSMRAHNHPYGYMHRYVRLYVNGGYGMYRIWKFCISHGGRGGGGERSQLNDHFSVLGETHVHLHATIEIDNATLVRLHSPSICGRLVQFRQTFGADFSIKTPHRT